LIDNARPPAASIVSTVFCAASRLISAISRPSRGSSDESDLAG